MGKIEIVCGPMFSGKTEELIRRMTRFKYSKKDFILFKPTTDDRYSKDQVVSHNKNSMTAVLVKDSDEMVSICNKSPEVKNIGIDEIQFLDQGNPQKLKSNILKLKRMGYHIIASGLDMDSKGDPFPGMPDILAIADDVRKIKSVCFECGDDGSMSHRINESKDLIQVGAQDNYKSLCFSCWQKYNP